MGRDTPLVGSKVKECFERREKEALELIRDSGINFVELGIFGSYARNEYTATSDIDMLAIVKTHPDRRISGELREILDNIKVDLVYVTPEYFANSTDNFACKVREDYIRRLLNE